MEIPSAKPLPVYLQIAELLARQLKAGFWRVGERLPTEAELSRQLGVAVGTLRKALALLEEQGALERIQGSGTYVKQVRGTGQIYELFRLELRDGPGLPTARVLDVEHLPRPAGMPLEGPSAWRVRRLRLLNDLPVALEEIWFEGGGLRGLRAEEIGDSMYLFYQQRLQRWIARVEDHVSAAAAPDWARPPFGLAPGACAGYIERISHEAGDTVAEFSRTWFDPAVCRYSSRMTQ